MNTRSTTPDRTRPFRRLGLATDLVLPLFAQVQPSMLYILDGSGSMWDRVGGTGSPRQNFTFSNSPANGAES